MVGMGKLAELRAAMAAAVKEGKGPLRGVVSSEGEEKVLASPGVRGLRGKLEG